MYLVCVVRCYTVLIAALVIYRMSFVLNDIASVGNIAILDGKYL